jgi:hypothetical protein
MANLAVTFEGAVTGLPEGSRAIDYSFSNSNAPGYADIVSLTTTPAALTIPTNTLFILIVPPASNTTVLRISGAVGETTGATLHATNPLFLCVPASSPNVYLFCTSGTVSNVQVFYY